MEGEVQLREGAVNGYKSVSGTVTYWRNTYGVPWAVEVTNAATTVVIPWRNVAVVNTDPSERGGMADAPV